MEHRKGHRFGPGHRLGRHAILSVKRALRDDGCVDMAKLRPDLCRALLARKWVSTRDARLMSAGWRALRASDRVVSATFKAAHLRRYNTDPEVTARRARDRARRWRERNAPVPWRVLMLDHLTIVAREGECRYPHDGEPTVATVQQWALRACPMLLQHHAETGELVGPLDADGQLHRRAVRYHLALWKLVARGCAYAKLAERRGDVVSVHLHAIPAAQVAKMPQAPFMSRSP